MAFRTQQDLCAATRTHSKVRRTSRNMPKGIWKGEGSQKQRIYSTKRAKKWGFVVKITTGENVKFSGVKVSKIVECCKKYNKKIVQNP